MPPVVRDRLSFAELLATDGVVEELELRRPFGFCAYHGGSLERRTDLIAREAAARSNSSYYGVLQPSTLRHHIPSAKIDPAVSERFRQFVEHCSVMVTVHGFGRRGFFTSLLCGGRNRELARHVATTLRQTLDGYDVVDELDRIPAGLRGTHTANPCNLTSEGGMQLELPPRIRGVTPAAIHWYRSPNGRRTFPPLEDLIEGLSSAARSWPPAG
jgi:phage replication-related protein YjqB (UPF0714/DUF867 family)